MLVNIHKHKWALLVLVLFVPNTTILAQEWSLQQCIDTAQVRNKSLLISENTVSISEQRYKEAMAGFLPKININGDYKYYFELPYQLMPMSTFNPTAPIGQFKEAQFGVPHNMNLSVQFSMPLLNAQLLGATEASKTAKDLSKLQQQKTREQVYFEVSNLFYNVQILEKQVFFVDSNLLNTNRLLLNMKVLKEQMMAKSSDVSKLELQMSQLETQRAIVNNKLQQVLNALKFTMGISIGRDLDIDASIEYDDSAEDTNGKTVDILLVETQNRMLKNELNTLKNSRLPSLSLYGTYGQTGFGYDEKPNDFLKFFPVSFVGIQLNYSVFNGSVTHRKIKQKNLELSNNKLQLSLVTEQNNMLIENARRLKTTARLTVKNTLAQIRLSQIIYEQTLLQHKQGTANLTDVLLADNSLREAQQNHLSAIIEFLKADLEIKKLTGNFSNNV